MAQDKDNKNAATSPAEKEPEKKAATAPAKKKSDVGSFKVAPRNTITTAENSFGPGSTVDMEWEEAVPLIERGVLIDPTAATPAPAPVMGSSVVVQGEQEVKIGRVASTIS